MRLVASPFLNEEDGQAISEGYEKREIIERSLVRELARDDIPDPIGERLGFLAWMVADGLLDVRIALVENEQGTGMYHEKFGIYKDSANNVVAFSGSANETVGGLINNFETVEVFRSWIEADAERANSRVYNFDMLWKGTTKGLKIYDFPEAARQELLRYQPENQPIVEPEEKTPIIEPGPHLPIGFYIRDYQEEAIQQWFQSGGRGIWEMATGTGKTATTLAAITKVFEAHQSQGQPLFVVIICPYIHLVEQWATVAQEFGMETILCSESQDKWYPEASDILASLNFDRTSLAITITTNSTFARDTFQSLITRVKSSILLVADEVHNMGSRKIRATLPEKAVYRLGLSATPVRHYDALGTEAIENYFGPSVFNYSIRDAISSGYLTPYIYRPIIVYLDDTEMGEYVDLTKKIGKMWNFGDVEITIDRVNDGPLKTCLFKRARLLGLARGKLGKLREIMNEFAYSNHNLVYCESGGDVGNNQLAQVTHLLGTELKMKVNTYTHKTSSEERARLSRELGSGKIQALVAIRCLDEGIDIPEARRGFIMASSTNPRQFIQRRGRLLRPSIASDKKEAEIYDFIAIPPEDALDQDTFEIERKLVKRELRRVVEFASEAKNGARAMLELLSIRKRYHLLDFTFGS